MKGFPLDIGMIHFVGIGGIGMSGIAEVMHSLGYQVQGSDMAESANVQRLRSLGIKISKGHSADNLGEARVIVVSTAVKRENPEVAAARASMIPVVRRAEMLAELMRFKWSIAVGGTHGKTTTTSMMAALLDQAGFDPTVINGGIINAYNTNARLGSGEWMVVEDESDGTFIKLPATITVVTNIDPEHLDFYGDFDSAKKAFQQFVENIPFYGFAAMCIDHPEVHALCGRVTDRKLVTYGFSPLADIRAENLRYADLGSIYDVVITDRVRDEQRRISNVRRRRGEDGAGELQGRQAALHQDGFGRRRDGHRRLRPPSGRNCRRAGGCAHRHAGARRCRGAAAPLHPRARPVRGILHLLRPGRHGRGGGHLSRRRKPN